MSELVEYSPRTAAARPDAAAGGVDSWVPVLKQVGELAQSIAGTEFVPKPLRGKPAAVAACILLGRELGLPPMTSLTSVDVIEGRPSLSATMMRALVRSRGHQLLVKEWTDQKCTIVGWRRGEEDPVATVTWTLADAQRAGLTGKQNWKQHPRAMLLARATGELCRAAFPDVIAGLTLSDDAAEETAPARSTVSRRRTPAAEVEAAPEAPVPSAPVAAEPADPPQPVRTIDDPHDDPASAAENDGDDGRPMTTRQRRMMLAAFNELGVKERDQRLEMTEGIVGRSLSSANDLTLTEASAVIDALTQGRPGTAS